MSRVIRALLHLPAFVLGGMLAAYLALWFLMPVTPINQATIGPLTYPWTLLFGMGAGAVCWLGFEVGRVRWRRRAVLGRAAVENAGLNLFGLTLLAYLLAGAAFISAASGRTSQTPLPPLAATLFALVVALAVVPFVSGLLAGVQDEPSVFLAFFMAPLLGVCGGFVCGIGSVVVYVLTYQPPTCIGRCAYFSGSAIGVYLLIFLLTAIGLGMGYLAGVASGLGLLVCRLTDRRLFREWRELPAPAPTPAQHVEGETT